MKRIVLAMSIVVICALLLPLPCTAQLGDTGSTQREPAPTTDPTKAVVGGSRGQEAPGEMITYQIGFLKKGPNWTPADTPELQDLQRRHLAHLKRMSDAGRLVVAGPLADSGEIRGILVFKGITTEQAKLLAEEDPAVKAGRLVVELHPWLVQKGVLP